MEKKSQMAEQRKLSVVCDPSSGERVRRRSWHLVQYLRIDWLPRRRRASPSAGLDGLRGLRYRLFCNSQYLHRDEAMSHKLRAYRHKQTYFPLKGHGIYSEVSSKADLS